MEEEKLNDFELLRLWIGYRLKICHFPRLISGQERKLKNNNAPRHDRAKTLQDNRREVGNIAAQRAFAHQGRGAEGEAFQVGRVSIGDG